MWWRLMIKDHNISPSEAWKLDMVDICCIADHKFESNQDTSMMVNAQRKANGMSEGLLRNKV